MREFDDYNEFREFVEKVFYDICYRRNEHADLFIVFGELFDAVQNVSSGIEEFTFRCALTNMAKVYPDFADGLLTCANNYKKFAHLKGLVLKTY